MTILPSRIATPLTPVASGKTDMTKATAPFHGTGPECRAAIEDLPHLVEKMCALWNSRDLNQFVDRILMDSRDGERRGLPVEAASELFFIAKLNGLVRSMDIAEKLQVSLGEADDILSTGDRAALGLPPPSADPWSDYGVPPERTPAARDSGRPSAWASAYRAAPPGIARSQ